MKRTIYLLVFLMAGIFFTAAAQYNWVGINSYEQAPADVRLVQSDIEQTFGNPARNPDGDNRGGRCANNGKRQT